MDDPINQLLPVLISDLHVKSKVISSIWVRKWRDLIGKYGGNVVPDNLNQGY
jgi:hypothetical protein